MTEDKVGKGNVDSGKDIEYIEGKMGIHRKAAPVMDTVPPPPPPPPPSRDEDSKE